MGNSYVSEGINGCQYLMAALSTSEVEMIVNIVCAVITTLILCSFRIWRWYKEAHKDGKITKEELKEGAEILVDSIKDAKEIKEDIDEIKNKKENK